MVRERQVGLGVLAAFRIWILAGDDVGNGTRRALGAYTQVSARALRGLRRRLARGDEDGLRGPMASSRRQRTNVCSVRGTVGLSAGTGSTRGRGGGTAPRGGSGAADRRHRARRAWKRGVRRWKWGARRAAAPAASGRPPLRRTEERAGHDKRRASRTRGARHRRANERDERALRHRAGRRERVRRRHGSGVDEGARGKVLSGWTAVPRYFRGGNRSTDFVLDVGFANSRPQLSRARVSRCPARRTSRRVHGASRRSITTSTTHTDPAGAPSAPTRHRLGLTRTTLFGLAT